MTKRPGHGDPHLHARGHARRRDERPRPGSRRLHRHAPVAKAEPRRVRARWAARESERKFDTLAEAVQGASDGDTIEVRGNGPFVTEPIDIQARPSRSGPARASGRSSGSAPSEPGRTPAVDRAARWSWKGWSCSGWAKASRRTRAYPSRRRCAGTGAASRRQLPFLMRREGAYSCIGDWIAPVLRRPQLRVPRRRALGARFGGQRMSDRRNYVVENCLHRSGTAVCSNVTSRPSRSRSRPEPQHVGCAALARPCCLEPDRPTRRSSRRFERQSGSCRGVGEHPRRPTCPRSCSFQLLRQGKRSQPADAEATLLPRLLAWQDERNRLPPEARPLCSGASSPGSERRSTDGTEQASADWKRFWGIARTELAEGQVRFEGGDLAREGYAARPSKLTPDDFRLRPDSAGYRAGKDGKDLGADVDLVGPGPAYERWKKTPEYQQWLKDTDSSRPKPRSRSRAPSCSWAAKASRSGSSTPWPRRCRVPATATPSRSAATGRSSASPSIVSRTALDDPGGEGFRPVIRLSPGMRPRIPAIL